MPATVGPRPLPPRALRLDFPARLHRRRWRAESTFSQHKRRLGAALTARSAWAQDRELVLRVLTRDLALLATAA